jgi:hypothetical protein
VEWKFTPVILPRNAPDVLRDCSIYRDRVFEKMTYQRLGYKYDLSPGHIGAICRSAPYTGIWARVMNELLDGLDLKYGII